MALASSMWRLLLRAATVMALWLGCCVALPASAERMTGSPAFERFRFSFFEDPNSARDGLDTAALLELKDEERRRAEDMLIRYLPDTRGIIGLAELRSHRAEPDLLRLFVKEREAQRKARLARDGEWVPLPLTYLAKALWWIRPDPRWLDPLVEILASAEFDVQRMDAAMVLSEIRDPVAVKALVAALDDQDDLVRYHAARSLLAIHALLDEADIGKHGREHMAIRVMSGDAARRQAGKRDVLAAIAGRPIVRN